MTLASYVKELKLSLVRRKFLIRVAIAYRTISVEALHCDVMRHTREARSERRKQTIQK